MSTARALLDEFVRRRQTSDGPAARDWLAGAEREIAEDVPSARFTALLSLASRHVARGPLAPERRDVERAFAACEGWNPERWTLLDAARAKLVLARRDLEQDSAVAAIEDAFRYADVGEACALHRTLALLPRGERFAWRAGEGCRSSMRAVFEAAACDTPFPYRHFDDLAWRQLVIKCVFVEAPLWRVFGLDRRVDRELARMALDLADERRSAGRPVPRELWLCLGEHAGERGVSAMLRELLEPSAPEGPARTLARQAAVIGLARAGESERLARHLERERDPRVAARIRRVLEGRVQQAEFRELEPETARND